MDNRWWDGETTDGDGCGAMVVEINKIVYTKNMIKTEIPHT